MAEMLKKQSKKVSDCAQRTVEHAARTCAPPPRGLAPLEKALDAARTFVGVLLWRLRCESQEFERLCEEPLLENCTARCMGETILRERFVEQTQRHQQGWLGFSTTPNPCNCP